MLERCWAHAATRCFPAPGAVVDAGTEQTRVLRVVSNGGRGGPLDGAVGGPLGTPGADRD